MNFDTTSIIEVARYNYKEQNHVENHCHNFHHLIFITGGEGLLRIDGKQFLPLENDLFVVQSGIYHEIISNSAFPLSTLEVKFVSEENDLINGLSKLPYQFNCDNIGVQSILERLVEEALNKQMFYKELITLQFIELLLCIIRAHTSNQLENVKLESDNHSINEDHYSHELVNKILKYIHRHYTEQLTLTHLSKVFNINQSYICRIFSKKYSIAPMQYVNNLKLQKVKKLLTGTNYNVTEISELVGFSSIHYFSRYFTTREKITPLEYRKKSKNVVHIKVEEKYKIINNKI